MLDENNIGRIRDFASGRNRIVAVYVFGSIATGRDRNGSDMDLAIMVRGSLSAMDRLEIETELSE
jgi:predicted nucleotidyltransferase